MSYKSHLPDDATTGTSYSRAQQNKKAFKFYLQSRIHVRNRTLVPGQSLGLEYVLWDDNGLLVELVRAMDDTNLKWPHT
jgi:hypothetical protein